MQNFIVETEIDIVVSKKILENKILELFNQGMTVSNISKELKCSLTTVRKYLVNNGITDTYRNSPSKRYYMNLSDNDKEKIKELYKTGDINKIFKLHPILDRQFLYTIMSRGNVSREKYFWTDEDTNYLKENFNLGYSKLYDYFSDRHTKKAIRTKAIKMGLTKPQDWTEEEIKILKDNYSILPKKDLQKLLPNRSWNAITIRGGILGIRSYKYLNEKYSEEEKNFIRENFGKMTDIEIANALGKSVRGISDQRHSLGLYYLDKNYSKYNNISKFFRAHIYDWKENSMKQCNYQCIFTGSKDYAIHHIISFNTILSEFFSYIESKNLLKSNNLNDYSKEELDNLIKIFNTIHDKYPLGICVRKDIHNLFHNIYGSGGNTKEQWDIFSEKYINHEYDDLIA